MIESMKQRYNSNFAFDRANDLIHKVSVEDIVWSNDTVLSNSKWKEVWIGIFVQVLSNLIITLGIILKLQTTFKIQRWFLLIFLNRKFRLQAKVLLL